MFYIDWSFVLTALSMYSWFRTCTRTRTHAYAHMRTHTHGLVGSSSLRMSSARLTLKSRPGEIPRKYDNGKYEITHFKSVSGYCPKCTEAYYMRTTIKRKKVTGTVYWHRPTGEDPRPSACCDTVSDRLCGDDLADIVVYFQNETLQ